MKFVLQPWQLFVIVVAGWINREQQLRIEYLQSEVAVLKENIGRKRILLTDAQRRRLAVKGKVIGRKALDEVGSLFTPDTILRWHWCLVARKWDYSDRKENTPGRLRVRQVIVDLTVRLAKENPTWGYDRIQGELAKVRIHITDTTVGNILKAHGIEPAPSRKRTGSWETFLKSHWDVIAAIDFTTVEAWTKGGLVTFYLLFVMELKTRRVHFAGCTTSPQETWMKNMARELTNCEDGFLNGTRYLIIDRDAKFSESFRVFLSNEKVKRNEGSVLTYTISSLSNLAVLLKQEDSARAKSMLKEALARTLKTLGPKHPETAVSMINVAAILDPEEATEALKLERQAYRICEESGGWDLPRTSEIAEHLARRLTQLGDFEEAELLHRRILAHENASSAAIIRSLCAVSIICWSCCANTLRPIPRKSSSGGLSRITYQTRFRRLILLRPSIYFNKSWLITLGR